MNWTQTAADVDYPESDGQPMGETDIHIEWIIRLRDLLRMRYRGQRVYVASDLLVYYEEGEPSRFVVPDTFVVLDCEPIRRRTFKIWEEGRTPDVAFEITSLSSRREDSAYKPQVYSRIGVHEYFLFDPTGDYLTPVLQGHRRRGAEFSRLQPDSSGWLNCEALGLTLRIENDELVLHDADSGARLLTEAETHAAEAEARAAEAEAERTAREQAEAEAEALRSELDRLKRGSRE